MPTKIVGYVAAMCAPYVLAGLAGCVHNSGELGATAYEQAGYGYKVTYLDPATKSLVDGDWSLDNYFLDGMGHWKAKEGEGYQAQRTFDENGDGQIQFDETWKELIFDLRLVSRRDNGVIWVKAHPVLFSDAHRDLDVVLNDYADGLAGAGLYAQSNLFSVERVKQRQFTTFVADRGPVSFGEVTGLASTVELAEVEKLRLDPAFRSAKVRIVIAKFNFYERASTGRHSHPWPVVTRDGKDMFQRPGLLIAGYYNTVDRFAEHLPEFERLLGRISFGSGSATGDPPPAPAPQAPALPAPPPPAPAPASSPK